MSGDNRKILATWRAVAALVLGGIGLAASVAAIHATPIAGVTDLGCPRGMDCATVLGSAYSKIGPIPLGVAGGFYFAMWMIFLLAWRRQGQPAHRWIVTLTVAAGVCFSIALLAVLAFVLRASCLYCLITHAANLAAAAILWPLRQWRIERATLLHSWKSTAILAAVASLIGVGLWRVYDNRVERAEAASREKTIW